MNSRQQYDSCPECAGHGALGHIDGPPDFVRGEAVECWTCDGTGTVLVAGPDAEREPEAGT